MSMVDIWNLMEGYLERYLLDVDLEEKQLPKCELKISLFSYKHQIQGKCRYNHEEQLLKNVCLLA